MNTGRFLALTLTAIMTVLAGCRNPFNPSAQIQFDRFYAGTSFAYALPIKQASAGSMASSSANLPELLTVVQLSNSSKVSGKITGYNVVYRQLSNGQPIATCGGATGRRFNTYFNIQALSSNAIPSATGQHVLGIVTAELLTYISMNLTTVNGGIDCEVTFYGEDDNGYDIQLDAVLHIDVL